MAKSRKEVARTDDRPSYLPAVNEGSRGSENVGTDDLIIPRLDVLQDLSPQRKKSDPAYIEGAEEGMLFNTVTGELYGKQVFFIPVHYIKEWLIWKKQDAGGGFNGSFPSELEAGKAFKEAGFENEMFMDKGQKVCAYEVVDTMNHFGLIFQSEDNVKEICISMAKSKAKVSRSLNTLVKMAGGDRFSRVYKITAIGDKNKVGQDFFNIRVDSVGYVSEALFKMGETMYESMSKLNRTVAHETETKSDSEEGSEY